MKKTIMSIFFILILLVLTGCLVTEGRSPFAKIYISPNGNETLTVEYKSEYKDAGCTAKIGSEILGYTDLDYKTKGKVDTSKLGTYTITYTAKSKGEKSTAVRTVKVVDKTAPVITAEDSIDAFIGTTSFNVKYTAGDNYDGDLTEKVVKTDGEDSILLSVTDSNGNTGSKTVKVNFVADTVAPVLKLAGTQTVYIAKGYKYTEPGYSANDNCDGNLTDSVTVSGEVNCSAVGSYSLLYTVKDKAGNTATAKRTVNVFDGTAVNTTNPGTKSVYLTFDDGPGKYTEQLLNSLAHYGVKATFFVTNQFPQYQYLIGREAKDGHTVAVHTFSHNWAIYDSEYSYLSDFNAMNEIIKTQTGKYSSIFRFPGGTSNTVSRKHCAGIMTKLNTRMKQSGYYEYDWNVDSGDVSVKTSAAVINNVTRGLSPNRANIVLMHDIKPHTVNAITGIMDYCIRNGYKFATISPSTPSCQLRVMN